MPIVMRLSVTQQAVPTAMKETNNFEQKLDRLIELCQQLKQENQALREQVSSLQHQLDWFKRQLFGSKSEKRFLGE